MSAVSAPVSFTWPGLIPGRFTTGTTPPMTVGNMAKPPVARSSGFSGLSVAPKSTVPAVICRMPPPEPMA